mmetsp:Transcript_34770/g.44830  ORF Transcript_34770/g.44830 Transcript_34770/m.44830 type:complete len:955 (+) Transcript_34770:67-2931(+)
MVQSLWPISYSESSSFVRAIFLAEGSNLEVVGNLPSGVSRETLQPFLSESFRAPDSSDDTQQHAWLNLTDGHGQSLYVEAMELKSGEGTIAICSSFPGFKLLHEILLNIVEQVQDKKNNHEYLSKLIHCVVYGIPPPMPGLNLSVSFNPPHSTSSSPWSSFSWNVADINPLDNDDISLDCISAASLVAAWDALIFEKPLVIVSSNALLLTPFVTFLNALLAPLRNAHPTVPILPPTMIDILEAPFPFLVGVRSDTFYQLSPTLEMSPSITVLDLDTGVLSHPNSHISSFFEDAAGGGGGGGDGDDQSERSLHNNFFDNNNSILIDVVGDAIPQPYHNYVTEFRRIKTNKQTALICEGLKTSIFPIPYLRSCAEGTLPPSLMQNDSVNSVEMEDLGDTYSEEAGSDDEENSFLINSFDSAITDENDDKEDENDKNDNGGGGGGGNKKKKKRKRSKQSRKVGQGLGGEESRNPLRFARLLRMEKEKLQDKKKDVHFDAQKHYREVQILNECLYVLNQNDKITENAVLSGADEMKELDSELAIARKKARSGVLGRDRELLNKRKRVSELESELELAYTAIEEKSKAGNDRLNRRYGGMNNDDNGTNGTKQVPSSNWTEDELNDFIKSSLIVIKSDKELIVSLEKKAELAKESLLNLITDKEHEKVILRESNVLQLVVMEDLRDSRKSIELKLKTTDKRMKQLRIFHEQISNDLKEVKLALSALGDVDLDHNGQGGNLQAGSLLFSNEQGAINFDGMDFYSGSSSSSSSSVSSARSQSSKNSKNALLISSGPSGEMNESPIGVDNNNGGGDGGGGGDDDDDENLTFRDHAAGTGDETAPPAEQNEGTVPPPVPTPAPRLTIPNEKFMEIRGLLCHHLSQQDEKIGDEGILWADLQQWYLEQREEDLSTEEELNKEIEIVNKVIGKLLKDGLFVIVGAKPEEKEDTRIRLYPGIDPSTL